MNKLNKIFNKNENIIIGAIHFAPLLDYPNFPGFKTVLDNALKDLTAFESGGVDGVIIENNYDIPHKITVSQKTIDIMIKLGKEIKAKTKLPIGVSVLWNDFKSALFIAKSIGAQFIRVPVFVDKVKTDYGVIRGKPKDVISYRRKIKAENISIFTDIHVKHSEILNKDTIQESAIKAIEEGSDSIIITGKWTGDAPETNDLKMVKKEVKNFPILIGSGTDKNNVRKLFKYSNGAIVGTSLKEGGEKEGEVNVKGWKQRIEKERVVALIKSLR